MPDMTLGSLIRRLRILRASRDGRNDWDVERAIRKAIIAEGGSVRCDDDLYYVTDTDSVDWFSIDGAPDADGIRVEWEGNADT